MSSGFPADDDFCRSIGGIEQLHFGCSDLQKGMPLVIAAAINHEGQPRGRRRWDARLEAVASSCRPAVAYQWGEAGMKP